jgi:hypothetical protein
MDPMTRLKMMRKETEAELSRSNEQRLKDEADKRNQQMNKTKELFNLE